MFAEYAVISDPYHMLSLRPLRKYRGEYKQKTCGRLFGKHFLNRHVTCMYHHTGKLKRSVMSPWDDVSMLKVER